MTRDELATKYLEQLPYPPYPVQEEALLAWFTADQGVLVCAPTGTFPARAVEITDSGTRIVPFMTLITSSRIALTRAPAGATGEQHA